MKQRGWYRSTTGHRRAHWFSAHGSTCFAPSHPHLPKIKLEPVTELTAQGKPYGQICALCETEFERAEFARQLERSPT